MQPTGLYGAQISAPAPLAPIQLRYCLYARKSSEAEERQALSIDSQIKEMLDLAQRENLNIVDTYRESHSAKDCGQRPVFNQLINDIRAGKFDGIVVWHPDRLSRNAGDLGAIVDLLDQKRLIEIRTHSQRFTNNPNEKFLLMILGSQAKLENDNKRINVKRGLRARAEMGLLPGVAPVGYLNDKQRDHKCEMIVDPVRAPIIKQIFEKSGYERWSGRRIYAWLKERDFRTKNNKYLSVSCVYITLKNPFYSGVYEYPRGSGNWYTGKHTPLVTRELYQLVQDKLLEDSKPKHKDHSFTFTRMMVCGECGSGVTAGEKTKNNKDGTSLTIIYYMCTKGKGEPCSNPYLREDELVRQLVQMIDEVEIDEIGARRMIEQEVARYNRLQAAGQGPGNGLKAKEMDVRRYAKYLLENGTVQEKRSLLEHMRGKIVMKDKLISLQ